MTFLNPFALLALVAVGIPLMLHLLNLRQPTTVDFSSLAFVETIEKAAVQRIQVKRWLLLALRILALACLVLAFSRPYWGEGTGTMFGPDARSSIGVVVDNSSSMIQDGPSGAYFDQATQRAQGVLRTVGTGDQVGIWPTLPDEGARSGLVRTAEAAQSDLDALSISGGTPALADRALDAAQAVANAAQPRQVVYVASDFQRTRLGDSLRTSWPDDVTLALLPVDTQPRPNTGVTHARVASPMIEAGSPIDIEASITHIGDAPESVTASLYFNDERVAQSNVSPVADDSVTTTFAASPPDAGWVEARIELEGDAFASDDTRYLSFYVPETREVLLVRESGQPTRFVELALSDAVAGDDIRIETTTIDRTDLSRTNLEDYDAVLLVGPQRLASGERSRLRQYVEEGGGAFLFPHPTPDLESYSALFEAWGGGQATGLSGDPEGDTSIATLDDAAFDHPLFAGMFDASDPTRSPELERPAVWAALDIAPAGGQGQTLMSLSTGAPFLHEWRPGQGRALVSAVAPNLEWSELPTQGLFVPLLYRSLFYISAGSSVEGPSLQTGQPETFTIRQADQAESIRLEGPDDTTLHPTAHPRPGGWTIDVPPISTPGVYTLRTDSAVLQYVAVNHAPTLTDLRPAPPNEAAAHFEEIGVPAVETVSVEARPEAVAAALEQQQAGGALWNVFVMMALIFLAAEMLVARLWTPEAASA